MDIVPRVYHNSARRLAEDRSVQTVYACYSILKYFFSSSFPLA